MAADGGCERDVVHRFNEGYRAWVALKSVLSNRGFRIQAKKCLYEEVIAPTAWFGAEASGISAERRIVNVLEMKCLRSLECHEWIELRMKRRAGIERELASKADQRVLKWFGHVERMDEYRMERRVLMAEVSGGEYEGDRG